ncbi:RNA degradosome polyphosphate kinase [Halobacillus massiliensis]|uniref:RNA degradosome polyphosphate kinase n=1 Tax=Halobacillus massiliensis TaxID=1926286 RepID=UPI0009E5A1AF|nr:RNA degradosome polyphosphate kinase [Halobacillus massiliensis]
MTHNLSLDSPEYYINRELSWLAFNERVLEEASDVRNPLLERLKYLAIFSSNLDEFFMVRVAGLKDQIKAGYNKPENKAGFTPKQQIRFIAEKTHYLVNKQYQEYQDMLPLLNEENISILSLSQLSKNQLHQLEGYFLHEIFPVLTPLAVDVHRPFPSLLSRTINLAIRLRGEAEKIAIVQVPSVLPRFVQINHTNQYVLLEEVVSQFSEKLFRGHSIESITDFRITRNADMTIHEEGARDLLREIEKELKKRKWGAAVRLEVREGFCDEKMVQFLLRKLEIFEEDVYRIKGPLDLAFLYKFYEKSVPLKEELAYIPLIPQPAQDIGEDEKIFDAILKRDVFLHHPYESFDPLIELMTEAAMDPDVLAIKQTLYRVSGDSPIINALKLAAENGKQVTVLVELKARFDEENNLQWARKLEKAGCHVIYGMTRLKTHSKITLIVRKKENHIDRFVHLGTGNYNDQTAKLYTDMGLMTTRSEFGEDATNFFNYLSGYTEQPDFHFLSMAPEGLKFDLLQKIKEEMAFHKKSANGMIIAKMNSLTDKDLIKKFYEASQAGVSIKLIVRGICCLRPGIPGISENIKVISIVGRFLEHSRVYYFFHNGEEKLYLSSADLMTRNMVKRVELCFPILDSKIKRRVTDVLLLMLADNTKARVLTEKGVYTQIEKSECEEGIDCQMKLFELAYQVLEDEE